MSGRRGIKLCPITHVKTKTELLELQLEHHGLRHQGCLLPEGPPCGTCGLRRPMPPTPGWELVLDARSVSGPEVPDLFTLKDGTGPLIANERFVEWALALRGPEPLGIRFEELKVA